MSRGGVNLEQGPFWGIQPFFTAIYQQHEKGTYMMADPIEYNNLGHMLANHLPYIVMGVVSIIGATMIVLNKMGILVFDKDKIRPDDCQHCVKDKDGHILPKVNCINHEEMKENQIKMLTQQQNNTAALRNGKKEFKEIKESLSVVRVDVATLLTRTEGWGDQSRK